MNDLAGWLLEQIAADEEVARAVQDRAMPLFSRPVLHHQDAQGPWLWVASSRLLAECAAKRRIVELHSGDAPWCGWTQGGDGTHGAMGVDPARPAPQDCATLRFLALPYADRPGYLDEWRVEAVAS